MRVTLGNSSIPESPVDLVLVVLAHFAVKFALLYFIKAEPPTPLVHFVSSSDTSDGWADKNQKYWPEYFINLLPGLIVLCSPEV